MSDRIELSKTFKKKLLLYIIFKLLSFLYLLYIEFFAIEGLRLLMLLKFRELFEEHGRRVLTPPSYHGLQTVNETEGVLEDVHPRMVRHLISPIVHKPGSCVCIYTFRTINI